MHWTRKWQPTPAFLPGDSQGWQSLVGCRLGGHTESDTTEWLSSSSSSVFIMLIHILYFWVTKNYSNTLMILPADIQRIYSKAWFIWTNAEKKFSFLFCFPNVVRENSLLFMNDLRQLTKHVNARVKWKSVSRVQLFATSRTIQSMEFSKPEYWSG